MLTTNTDFIPPMRARVWLLVVATLAICMMPLMGLAADTSGKEKIDDVRVLIDISGSMKRTDPQNLRVPAMRLFTTLLPVGTHAGVWSFGEYVNMLVPHGLVDKGWKQRSRDNISGINSSGLYTNIEEAIKQATRDWREADDKVNRNLILLTDGLVDVSKDSQANAASRQAILEEYLPHLEAIDVKIHTIALSGESDQELLRQLATATGGWFETIDSADGLERLFLRMFEKVAHADSLPMTNNLVKIDKSIKEVTFLIFSKDRSQGISLTTPSKTVIRKTDNLPEVEWHHGRKYDLITISNPEIGSWLINADVDPDNRAMVVTDLKMKHTVLPNSIEAGAPLAFKVHLEEDGEIITRKEFLRFVRVKATQVSDKGKKTKFKLKDNGRGADEKKGDGIFTVRLKKSLREGDYDFIVELNGTTFKRSTTQSMKITNEPVDVLLKPLKDGRYMLSVIPNKSLVESDAMRVDIEHIFPSGDKQEHKVPRISSAEWRLDIDTQNMAGGHQIILHVSGNRPDGSSFDVTLDTRSLTVDAGIVESPQEDTAPLETDESENAMTEPEESETNLLILSISLLLFNLIFGSIGFMAYKFWPKISEKIIPNPAKELVYE